MCHRDFRTLSNGLERREDDPRVGGQYFHACRLRHAPLFPVEVPKIKADVAFFRKSCTYGTIRTRTARWKIFVHLLFILCTSYGHVTERFDRVTCELETLPPSTKGKRPHPPHKTQPHTDRKHPIPTFLPRTDTKPPYGPYTKFSETQNNHATHTTEPRVGSVTARTLPHTYKKHPIPTPLPRTDTEPPHHAHTKLSESENNHETHTTEPRLGIVIAPYCQAWTFSGPTEYKKKKRSEKDQRKTRERPEKDQRKTKDEPEKDQRQTSVRSKQPRLIKEEYPKNNMSSADIIMNENNTQGSKRSGTETVTENNSKRQHQPHGSSRGMGGSITSVLGAAPKSPPRRGGGRGAGKEKQAPGSGILRDSIPPRGATNIWYSILVMFVLLVFYTHTTTCLRSLEHGLTSACTFLERTIAHSVHTHKSHTPPSDQDGAPVRWMSRQGNLRTRGKRLKTPNSRTYRGCRKWINHPATTKPKCRLSTVWKRTSAWRRTLTHITYPAQEQQEGHGPMPPDVAPSNSDCKRTVSAHSGPGGATISGRAQQVGGGVSGWIGDTFYDSDDDEPVQNRDQPAGHDTRIEPPPHPIQHHPKQTARRDPAGGWDSMKERPRGYILNN